MTKCCRKCTHFKYDLKDNLGACNPFGVTQVVNYDDSCELYVERDCRYCIHSRVDKDYPLVYCKFFDDTFQFKDMSKCEYYEDEFL